MICIIANSYQEAWVYARSQLLDKEEWFFPNNLEQLYSRENFHVIVANNHPNFELIYKIARERGRMNRK